MFYVLSLLGFETKNKFTIKNDAGQKMYRAVEDSDCCTRCFCGPLRPFDMKILDANNMEVIHLNRQLACDSCFFPCCLQVSAGNDAEGRKGSSIDYVSVFGDFSTPPGEIL